MYVAVKGGETAIARSWDLLAASRRGDPAETELSLAQIRQQMRLAVARVMQEGSLYDEHLAALALKQAAGDVVEAVFLLRAFRTTLPRLATSLPLDTADMRVRRRISGTFKDVPGGQILGPTADYTQRLLDFTLADATQPAPCPQADAPVAHPLPSVLDTLSSEGLIEAEPVPEGDPEPVDLTRSPLMFPTDRATRLQNLARADEGWLLGLAYSTQRGYAESHPFAGEIRMGEISIRVCPPELGFDIEIGEITLTECQMINQFAGSKTAPPQFTRGYGLSFGESERKAMAMALVDRSLRAGELGEDGHAPAQQQEFVLYHSDNVEASGFVQHLKLPHYVDFQAELALIRTLRQQAAAQQPQEDGHE
ncbi:MULTISPECIES: carbon-phosphorus lyase complex subunit PhnI [unclassified Paludibacterium]|uniref:carbon-phosphorus lyase complex subunit PhnI n=1 Tax=unclassified Paludibacterium TaxID=2618429 RepID=UPI001C0553C4|nr:carbon-phosphorus lyase complex subunit PhnI [Paludibacterium sp. B53371]BEV71657.1 carbon-phosphorus lyase complex subunit PhnI [Paludibacterium sp. THUN1379]